MNRRTLLALAGAASLGSLPQQNARAAALPHLIVYRDPGCGCCEGWVEHMRAAGFTADIIDDAERARRRAALGIGDELASCHTAVFDGFAVEGHVPAADVIRLIAEKPDGAYGLAVPGMPAGSPGMGPEGSGPPYDTLLLTRNGPPKIYATH